MENFPFFLITPLILLITIPLQVVWILMIIEVCRLPDGQYRAVGTEKVTWVIVVAVCGFVGALVWYFSKRAEVLAAAGAVAAWVPAGWYLEPDGVSLRWWDGVRWTEHRSAPAPPSGATLN